VIPFEWLRDDSIRGQGDGHVPAEGTPKEEWLDAFVAHVRKGWKRYAIHPMTGQSNRVEVWCESAGMQPQLQRVADPYGIPVFSGTGAESISARRNVVDRCVAQVELPTHVLQIGDYDLWGVDIFRAMEEDVKAFLAVDAPGAEVHFHRLAVTLDQVHDPILNLPMAPPKLAKTKGEKTRAKRWEEETGSSGTCQAEALAPDVLAEILEQAILQHVDIDVMDAIEAREAEAREWLRHQFEDRFGPEEEVPS
jgi:hypothetical protein